MTKWPIAAVGFRSLIVCLGLAAVATAQTNSTTAAGGAAAPDDIDWSRHVVEAYRDYTNQQKLTFDVIEKARAEVAEAAATAKENAAKSDAQLKHLELTWAAQHERDMAAVQAAHQFAVKVIGAFAALGLLGLVLLAFVMSRAVNRRLELVTTALASRARGALPAGETALVPLDAVTQSNARFVNAIERDGRGNRR